MRISTQCGICCRSCANRVIVAGVKFIARHLPLIVWGIQVLAPVFDGTALRGFVGVSIALARLNTLLERQNSVRGIHGAGG